MKATEVPPLERQGIPREGGPVGVMLSEHEEGRRWVRLMEEAGIRYRRGEAEARRNLIEAARGAVRFRVGGKGMSKRFGNVRADGAPISERKEKDNGGKEDSYASGGFR